VDEPDVLDAVDVLASGALSRIVVSGAWETVELGWPALEDDGVLVTFASELEDDLWDSGSRLAPGIGLRPMLEM
jgi:hypothetical protein